MRTDLAHSRLLARHCSGDGSRHPRITSGCGSPRRGFGSLKRGDVKADSDQFPSDIENLPEADAPELVELRDGDRFELRIAPVAKRLGEATIRMLAYNGSIPGPILKVPEGSEITVEIENQRDMETTVHWHGLRLDNRYDGTHETQAPIPVGKTFSARCAFPDPAISANGRFVAFSSSASDLVEGDRFNTFDTFVRGPLR
jgi:FtsP/CotA-like multicopper oxidase with cupredoxin domain